MTELRETLSNDDRLLLNLAADTLASEYHHRATDDEFYKDRPQAQQEYGEQARRLLELAELLINADEIVAITRPSP